MKTVKVQLYTFSELEKNVQEKVLEDFRNFNTDHNWWEDNYDDFERILSFIGVRTSAKDIFFNGFWSQGSGSSFASKIDVLQFIKGIREEAWREHAPTLELKVTPCPIHKKVIDLIENGTIELSLWTEVPNSGYWLKYQSENDLSYSKNYHNIENELERLDEWALQNLEILNKYLYEDLKNTCEYLMGDESLQDSIESNEYLFTANGKHADWLLKLT